MRAMAKVLPLILVAVLLAGPARQGGAEAADAPRCNGLNLLDKLAATDPGLHDRVIDNADSIENGKAVLWKIERTGHAPSHLFGTVHLSDARVTRLSDAVRGALANARAVIIENSDLSPEASANAYQAAADSAMFKDGRTLDKLMSAADFEKLQRTVKGTPQSLRPYRPWIVSLMLSGSECERQRVSNGEPVLDMTVANYAKTNGIPLAGLESTQEQLEALASIPDDEQVGILRANLALMDEADNLMETMVQLYLRRRVGALWDLQIAFAEKAGVPSKDFASFERTIIIERNRRMRDRSMPHIEKGGAFIAVGALHLPGKTGLVALLREAGYTVTAIE
jgi:uncharacterized protein YbaP (TraB family)